VHGAGQEPVTLKILAATEKLIDDVDDSHET